ncbi:MAG: hypothetical protein LAQ69_14340 [Acidobacteriia bacterium]|nr:hypothetical protein [Terriglobia bacterium]
MIEKERIDQVIDHILCYMSLSELQQESASFHKLSLSWFSDADPLMEDWLKTFQRARTDQSERLFFADAKPSDVGAFDICWLGGARDDDGGNMSADQAFTLQRHRRLPLKDVRGRFPMRTGVVVESSIAFIKANATYESARMLYEYRGGKWVAVASHSGLRAPSFFEQEHLAIQLAMGMAFSRQYEWRVSLGWAGCPTISFLTDPVGAREVFRLRDIPNGQSRRSALRHWVVEHWRKSRRDDAEVAKVRTHLRGSTDFTWNGLACRILPSADDVRKAGGGAA